MCSIRGLCYLLVCAVAWGGCSSYDRTPPVSYVNGPAPGLVLGQQRLDPRLAQQVLALDPDNLSDRDVERVLSRCPAPRLISIHGGTMLVSLQMRSFSQFLEAMGYPQRQIRHPVSGDYSITPYGSRRQVAGMIAWYYEREGLRPMLVGHSQGGMEAVKVLHTLSGGYGGSCEVYNPMAGRYEDRDWILHPHTGERVPVVGSVQVSFASAVGAGGLTRLLPNQWDAAGRLREIPDSAVEFSGFYMVGDLLGSDLLGVPQANRYHATRGAVVRTVLLPVGHNHYFVPGTRGLARDPELRTWISEYRPASRAGTMTASAGPADNIVWAAEMWTSIRRHWCLEVQQLVRAQQEQQHGRMAGQADRGRGIGADVLDVRDGQRRPGQPADQPLAQP